MVFRFYFLIFCSSFLWETFPDSGVICHELSILIFEKLLKIIFLNLKIYNSLSDRPSSLDLVKHLSKN